MTEDVTEPTSINAVVKWIILAIAVVSVVVVLVTTRRAQIERVNSTAPGSSPSSAAAQPGVKSPVSATRASKLCFTRGGWIYLKDLKTGTETKLVEGMWPDLSPDGSTLIFMSGGDTDSTDKWRMKAFDLTSLQVREFSSLAGRRILSPSWSSDGTRIAFVTINSDFSSVDIGVFDPSTNEWKNLTEKLELGSLAGGIDFDSWVTGDQSVLFHTLENLYEVSVSATLVSKIPIANLQIDSSTKFSFSADKKQLLFNQMIDTAKGPNEKVSLLNIDDGLVTKITPGTIEARRPRWLPSQREIVFTCMKRSARPPFQPSICKIGIDGTGLKVLARDADIASFSVD